MSIGAVLKLGLTVGLQIYDRTRPDPLDGINAQLAQLRKDSAALLNGIDTVQSTLVKTTLADRESDIRQALYYLRDAQTNDDKAQVKLAKEQALILSLDAITDLTLLANTTSASEIERAAVIPLLMSAISTRVQVIKYLKDGAFATPDGKAIDDAADAIRLSLSGLKSEIKKVMTVIVDSGALGATHATVTLHFVSAADPSVVSSSHTVIMTNQDAVDVALIGIQGPGPRDMAAFVDWDVAKNFGRLTSGESGVWRPDLKAAGYFGIKQFWQDMNFLDEGQWHQGDAGDNVLESLVYTTYLDTPFFGNVLDGNDGDDRLVGYAGNDALRGGKGADILEGQNGDDVLKGGPGQDRAIFQSVTWFSSKWNDAVTELITTKHKANRPVTVDLAKSGPQDTGYGLDTLISIEHVTSGSRNDKLMGNAGANSLVSGGGNDRIWGRDGDDRLNGGKNNDKIFGGNGDDQLVGGSGKDILRGDGGKDRMSGGAGADLFVFTKISDSAATKAGADLITDFRQGLDRIDLQAIDASKQLSGNNAFTFDGTKPFGTSRKGDIYFKQVDNAGTKNDFTLVFIDTDSDRDAEMMLKLNGLFTLTAGDFIL